MTTPANKTKSTVYRFPTINSKNATDSKKPGSVGVPLSGGAARNKAAADANKKKKAQLAITKDKIEVNKYDKAFNSAKAELRKGGAGLDVKKQSKQGITVSVRNYEPVSRRQTLEGIIKKAEEKDPSKYKSVKGGTPPASKQTPQKGKVVEAKTNPTKALPQKGNDATSKTKTPPKASSYATANKSGAMDKLVATRNSSSKGSREYAAAQNQINAAMGSKVRHKAKDIEPVSTIKSSGVVATKEFKKPSVSTTPEAVQLPSKKGESAVTKKEKGFFGKKSAMKSVAKKIKR